MTKYIAMYLRLSQDDVDIRSNALKDESESIQSQRMLLKRYISENKDLNSLPVKEFIDDGFTGTNFDRPEFKRMLAMIRGGFVECVIVKDLSRFGRNYLEVGDYLEHIFPFLKVRFIAVNDNYDSNSYLGTTGGIDVAFRNLVYQRYSQDLSEKVKSAMHLKMKKGRYVTNCPYGYMKKPGVKHEMIPNPETAPVVREIFLSAIKGMRSTEIAVMLNERQILTPMVYKGLSRQGMHNDPMWSHQAVLRIIKDYKYTGAMVNFKCENETIRALVQRKCSPDEWVIVENSHEAIVTHEEYKMANESVRRINYKGFKRGSISDRVYYCAYCGRRLRKTYGSDEYYSCTTRMYRTDSPCAKIRWSRTGLEEVVLAAYKAQMFLMNEAYKKASGTLKPDQVKICRERQKEILRELESCASRNLSLYERYRDGELDKAAFMEKKTGIQNDKEQLQICLEKLRAEEEELISQKDAAKLKLKSMEEAEAILEEPEEELRERMYAAIDKVVVYADKEIDIRWRLEIDFEGEQK